MKKRKVIAIILSAILFAEPVIVSARGNDLTESQKKIADKVAKKTTEKWDECGVLPSVAVVQAFVESSLGDNQVKQNNLWGIRPGGVNYAFYSSVDDGIEAYLDVLNDGLYDRALYKKEYRTQLKYILAGGYYREDDGGTNEEYYKNCVYSIEKYGFDRYDKELFRQLEEKSEQARKKKWEKTYTLHYDSSLSEHEVRVDKKIINGGVVQIWKDDELKGIYDVARGQKGLNIGISDSGMDGMKVKIIVNEEAKG